MSISEVQNQILKLKKEKDVCILAHCYQSPEILEIADFTGDSFALSVSASEVENKTVIMCGVRFMAETCKILSPDKKVILANPSAGCPMAEMMDKDIIEQVKEQYPDYTVVAYINTTSELKTVYLVCRLLLIKFSLFPTVISETVFQNNFPKRNLNSLTAAVLPMQR